MSTPILYLAHPYSNDPKESFHNACKWTRKLREKNFVIFSPILHTYCYDRFHKTHLEDYVAWDLKIMEGFMNGDGNTWKCPECDFPIDNEGYCSECDYDYTSQIFDFVDDPNHQKFDSGIILLLSNTAYRKRANFFMAQFGLANIEWLSSGCHQEYEFAHSHYIRILELESFLEGKEVDL